MSRFYLHLYNSTGPVCDEDGLELESLEAARAVAIRSIRDVISEEARHGRIDLRGKIEIENESKELLAVIRFEHAFELQLDQNLA